jgi:hypothetical protein
MFLYEFGSNLKELTGEEGDLDSLNDWKWIFQATNFPHVARSG